MAGPGDPQLQADTLFQPLCLLYGISKEAPWERRGKELSESKQTLQLDRKTSKNSKQHSQDTVFLKSRGIVNRTSFLRLLFSPFFLGIIGQRRFLETVSFANSHHHSVPFNPSQSAGTESCMDFYER